MDRNNGFSIVWFRQDLRLHDNPALHAAAEAGKILPIYILDDENAADDKMGAASRVWLHHSLVTLNESLSGQLQVYRGDALEIFNRLGLQLDVTGVYWNRCYEPWRIQRDAKIKSKLIHLDIEVKSFNGSLLWEPWEVAKADGEAYRVFTAYYRNARQAFPHVSMPLGKPDNLRFVDKLDDSLNIPDLKLVPEHSWGSRISRNWKIGESAATSKLDSFCLNTLVQYPQGRDVPAISATSRLSPHLHFGEISSRQVWYRLTLQSLQSHLEGLETYYRELAWREFSYYQLYHNPELPRNSFNPKYRSFDWKKDNDGLERWQQGKTGFPLIDAGMRELWQTGYMHNRVRMIVASFLVKNLLIDWREGASWFWDCLFDADLASNSASWQWCAGCGADAAPYFRIFNPVLQSQKFDPDAEYIRRYCPELSNLPIKYQHQPWMSDQVVDFPEPMVDLKTTRLRAIEWYKIHLQ